MSLGLHKASRMVRVSDPRLSFDEQGIQVISESAAGLIYQKFVAAPTQGNIINFNTFQTPTQAISTKMFIKTSFTVVVDSGNNAQPGFVPGFDAPRQFPLHSVAQNARIQINGASNDIYPNQIIHAMMRYNNTVSELGRDLSGCPIFPDMYQDYNDGNAAVGGWNYPAGTGYGTSLDCLRGLGESSFDMEPRGGWVKKVVFSGAGDRVATITFDSIECVPLSPLLWGHDSQKALLGVNTLNITYNLGDLTRVWSHNLVGSPGRTIQSATINGNPELYCVLMQPKMIDKIDPVQIYPWNQIFPYQQTFEFPIAGASDDPQVVNTSFNTIQLSGVPKRIYIYAKRATETAFTTDTFAGIKSLSVQFDTVSGIFSGADQQTLYNVCVENGYNGSFMDWSYYSGSIMAIDCEKDLPLGELLSVGTSKQIPFNFKVDFVRLFNPRAANAAALPYKLYCMVVYEGIFSIDQFGTPLFQLNTLTPSDLINAKEVQKLPYNAIKGFASGGSFGSKLATLGSFAKKLGRKAIGAYENLSEDDKRAVGNIVNDAATLVSPALGKAIQDFGPAAYDRAKKLVGMGYSENQIYEMLAGAGMKKKKTVGGKKITKAQLQKLAMA